MFNFPNSPSVGQKYEPVGGPAFAWDGVAWKANVQGVPVTVYVSDTPPASPALGQLWWDSDSGNLFIWYADGDSTQWVQVSGMPATAKPTALSRNRVVNGAMQISQENVKNTAWTVNGTYLADQWYMNFAMGGALYGACYPATTGGDPEVNGFIRLSGTTADAAVAAGDYFRVAQWIEGSRVYDFKWGSSVAKPAVLRFKARSGILGTFSVAVRSSSDYTFVKNFTFTQISTWTDFTVVIPPLTTGTFVVDTAASVQVQFTVMCGATNLAPSEGSWVSGAFMAAPGISNWMSVANQIFDVANVGLYLDPDNTGLAPPWQMPDEAEELQACQRYWEKSVNTHGVGNAGYIATTNVLMAFGYFKAPKRISPAITLTDGGGTNVGAATAVATVDAVEVNRTALAATYYYFWNGYVANARL